MGVVWGSGKRDFILWAGNAISESGSELEATDGKL